MAAFAIFLCLHFIGDPPIGSPVESCHLADREHRYQTIVECRAFLENAKDAYLRHDDQGRYFIRDVSGGKVISWNECQMTDEPASSPRPPDVAKLTFCTRYPSPEADCHDIPLPRVMKTLEECDSYVEHLLGHPASPPYNNKYNKRFYVDHGDDAFYTCGWGRPKPEQNPTPTLARGDEEDSRIYAIFLCFQADNQCQMFGAPRMTFAGPVPAITFPGIANCQDYIRHRLGAVSPADDLGRFMMPSGMWYECRSKHIDTWQPAQ